jgi:quercetin dioxygenase-like cupin family protein
MKFFAKRKDGGPESTVTGYWIAEIKSLFSVVLLKFENGSRDAYHSHAFNSLNWVLKGRVVEYLLGGEAWEYNPEIFPVVTKRDTFHRVVSEGTTWVLSLRGPWAKTWQEFIPGKGFQTLTHGRKVV